MLKRRTFVGELSAEFLGTFFILLFGIASVVQAYAYPGGIYTTSNIPWAWGFAVALGVYVCGRAERRSPQLRRDVGVRPTA